MSWLSAWTLNRLSGASAVVSDGGMARALGRCRTGRATCWFGRSPRGPGTQRQHADRARRRAFGEARREATVRSVTVDNSVVSDQRPTITDLGQRANVLAASASNNIDGIVALGIQRMLETSLAIVILTAVALTFVVRSITTPIHRITSAAGQLARSDIEVEATLPAPSKDELDSLCASFRNIAKNQRDMVIAAEAVAGGDLRIGHASHGPQDRLGQAFESMIADLRKIISSVGVTSKSLAVASDEAAAAAKQSATAVGAIAQESISSRRAPKPKLHECRHRHGNRGVKPHGRANRPGRG